MTANLMGVDWNYKTPDIILDELTLRRLEIDEQIECLRKERRELQTELDCGCYKEKEKENG